jgi:coenzyme PQQ precursor peptide PqqA
MYGLDLGGSTTYRVVRRRAPRKCRARPLGSQAEDPRSCAMNVVVTATEQKLPEVKREWVKPDFRDFETPMEVTAYAARS